MTAYLIRRLFQMALVTLLAAVTTYYLFTIAPGGPLAGLAQQQQRLTQADLARLRAQFDMDLYWPVRFSRWFIGWPRGPLVINNQEILSDLQVGCYMENPRGECIQPVTLGNIQEYHPLVLSSRGVVRGDFGKSTVLRPGGPVIDEIASRIGPTLELMISALVMSLLIGVPIGIYSAVRQYSRFDYFFTTLSFIGSSMPVFFFGLLLILAFSVMPVFLQDAAPWVPRLPPGSRTAIRGYEIATWLPRVAPGTFADRFLHLLMPLTVLTFFNTATWSRFVRSSMLEVLRQDYVRTARAKGLVERIVIMKHTLRNALIPFVTILVLQIPNVFSGAIITETVFAWPGMGRLFVDALNRSDWPIALAFVLITAFLTVLATLIGDILYTVVDPRIKFT
jgi:peptide/nickel transport system permease protein